MSTHKLAVWGDPIAHSKSPALHAAAYRHLGLDWEYDRRQVDAASFASTLSSLDDSWLGLSLTMPLKEEAFRTAAVRDPHAEITGTVNTLLLGESPAGFNTDVGGIIDALAEADCTGVERVRVLGAGATAASAIVAVAELGAAHVDVRARHPERARALIGLAEKLEIDISVSAFDAPTAAVDVTVATLPSGTVLDGRMSESFAAVGGTLFDAAYEPWPSALAASWGTAPVIPGLSMLLHQAVRQVRVFLHGDAQRVLDDEHTVLAVMRAALADEH